MKIAEICSSPVFVAYPDQALALAVAEMRRRDIGALVVIAADDPGRSPLGILTDRDILCGQIRQAADLRCLTVGDVMTHHPLCIDAEAQLSEAIAAMASRAVRRAPVIDAARALVGIVTLDDLLPAIARELKELAETVAPEPRRAPYAPPEGTRAA
ncbi:MAG TPA: CBS domain-containing protein [Steroidobacteraceae bacterium]|jgi:CBS domain-containing protein|nr:CBS domain-containing protein [Steroidobacteraceae bacterium]